MRLCRTTPDPPPTGTVNTVVDTVEECSIHVAVWADVLFDVADVRGQVTPDAERLLQSISSYNDGRKKEEEEEEEEEEKKKKEAKEAKKEEEEEEEEDATHAPQGSSGSVAEKTVVAVKKAGTKETPRTKHHQRHQPRHQPRHYHHQRSRTTTDLPGALKLADDEGEALDALGDALGVPLGVPLGESRFRFLLLLFFVVVLFIYRPID